MSSAADGSSGGERSELLRQRHQGFTRQNTVTLATLTLSFVVGEVCHFLIVALSRDVARDVGFGTMRCYDNQAEGNSRESCQAFEEEQRCKKVVNSNGNTTKMFHSCNGAGNGTACSWLHDGQGVEYQVLAGPIFVVIYTASGVLMGLLGDHASRPALLSGCIAVFSLSSGLTAFATQYWHLVLLRIGTAVG